MCVRVSIGGRAFTMAGVAEGVEEVAGGVDVQPGAGAVFVL